MKYITVIPDGAADIVSDFPQGATPLHAAETPFLDELADCGEVGWAKNVPDGLHPGSDVACLSIFGYDPAQVYIGRAPLEAASKGIELGANYAFRCNLVTIEAGLMKEFTAGHISTEEAAELIDALNRELGGEGVCFHVGVQYRHLMVAPSTLGDAHCTPPHDFPDQPVEPNYPQGVSRQALLDLMERSKAIFADHPVNRRRVEANRPPATQIWLWGQGPAPRLSPYKERIGLTGGVITAVDLIRGIGTLASLKIMDVEGATGLPDTNYEGKAQAALELLRSYDFALVHVEAPDEMGHKGDEAMKVRSIADFDRRMVKPLVEGLRERGEEFRLLALPDHPTPISLRTHTSDPVPFLLYDSRKPERKGAGGYSEVAVRKRTESVMRGHRLLDLLTEKMNIGEY